MASDKPSQSGRGSGDVFSSFLNTVRGGSVAQNPPDAAQLALLRLLKVFGPQKLGKLQAMASIDPATFINTFYQLVEDKRIEISHDDPDPHEAEVKMTQEGEIFLAEHK